MSSIINLKSDAAFESGHVSSQSQFQQPQERASESPPPPRSEIVTTRQTLFNFNKNARIEFYLRSKTRALHEEMWSYLHGTLAHTLLRREEGWDWDYARGNLEMKTRAWEETLVPFRRFLRDLAIISNYKSRRLSIVQFGAHTGGSLTQDPIVSPFEGDIGGILNPLFPGLPYEGSDEETVTDLEDLRSRQLAAQGLPPSPRLVFALRAPTLVLVEPNEALLPELTENHMKFANQTKGSFATLAVAACNTSGPSTLLIPNASQWTFKDGMYAFETLGVLIAGIQVSIESFAVMKSHHPAMIKLREDDASMAAFASYNVIDFSENSWNAALQSTVENISAAADRIVQNTLWSASLDPLMKKSSLEDTVTHSSVADGADGIFLRRPITCLTTERIFQRAAELTIDMHRGEGDEAAASSIQEALDKRYWLPDVVILDAEGADELVLWSMLRIAGLHAEILDDLFEELRRHNALIKEADAAAQGLVETPLQKQVGQARQEFLDAVARNHTLPFIILFESWSVQEFYDSTEKSDKPPQGFFSTRKVEINLLKPSVFSILTMLMQYSCAQVASNDVFCSSRYAVL